VPSGYPGRIFLLLKVAHGVGGGNYTATLAYDITGPWWYAMSWWTTAAGLTPVAAFDASRISDAQLLDGVGVNHITATSTLLPNDFQLKSVAGNGNLPRPRWCRDG